MRISLVVAVAVAGIALLFTVACGPKARDVGEPSPERSDPSGASGSEPIGTPGPAVDLSCGGRQAPFVTDREIRQTPGLAEQKVRVAFRDPVFGTCLVRVTDRRADLRSSGDMGLKNEYSRVQSFNADETRIIVRSTRADWYLYDAKSLQPLTKLNMDGWDPRWDAANPDLFYFNSGGRLMRYDVRTGERNLVHDFNADFPGQKLAEVWSKYEGNPTNDGRTWGFMAENENWETVAFVIYDLKEDKVIAKRDMRGVPGIAEVDNVYMSPLGTYFIADYSDHYCPAGSIGTDAKPCGVMRYDRSLENGRGLLPIMGHADMALDAAGKEVFVYQDVRTDHVTMVEMATGTVTPLFPIDFSKTAQGMHISGRAVNRPGWVVLSAYNGGEPDDFTWMDDQVILVELRKGGRVIRLAHHHSLYNEKEEHDYWAEPHASANRNLTRILFTSNWGRSGSVEVDTYMIALPEDWPDRLR